MGAVNPFWGLLPPALWGETKDFFVYGTDFLPLTASATLAQDIPIQADSHYMIMAGVRTVFQTDNTTIVANPAILVRIFDTGSGRQVQNRAVHIDNWFGTGQLPAYWPYPKIIKASSTLRVELTDLSGVDRNVRVEFLGFKIFTNLPLE